jgi:hypothetical protein
MIEVIKLSQKIKKPSTGLKIVIRLKSGKPNIAPLQPPTLAAFRPWGSSAGAGRADLPLQN